MQAVQGAVEARGNGERATVTVRTTFAGSTGRVTSSTVNGNLPGAVADCITSAVGEAQVPPFQRSSFSVNFPFRI